MHLSSPLFFFSSLLFLHRGTFQPTNTDSLSPALHSNLEPSSPLFIPGFLFRRSWLHARLRFTCRFALIVHLRFISSLLIHSFEGHRISTEMELTISTLSHGIALFVVYTFVPFAAKLTKMIELRSDPLIKLCTTNLTTASLDKHHFVHYGLLSAHSNCRTLTTHRPGRRHRRPCPLGQALWHKHRFRVVLPRTHPIAFSLICIRRRL